ncbi:MAG: hypothetical protein HC802_16805 [Caldilineaceae bacterium]|nr:hypothetical protein [Caldilineaceae bacterium]
MTRKIALFGMDGFITPMMRFFAAEGSLPTFSRMIDEGTVNQTLPSFPVWTPTNWATLSTGAHTGTHDVTTWSTEIAPGVSVDSFDGRANKAERIWNALEKAGLKGAALHYPGAHRPGPRPALSSTALAIPATPRPTSRSRPARPIPPRAKPLRPW